MLQPQRTSSSKRPTLYFRSSTSSAYSARTGSEYDRLLFSSISVCRLTFRRSLVPTSVGLSRDELVVTAYHKGEVSRRVRTILDLRPLPVPPASCTRHTILTTSVRSLTNSSSSNLRSRTPFRVPWLPLLTPLPRSLQQIPLQVYPGLLLTTTSSVHVSRKASRRMHSSFNRPPSSYYAQFS